MNVLQDLGLDVKLLAAGFAGGVVHVFAFTQTKPIAVIGSVVTGLFTANYIGPVANQFAGVANMNFGVGAWAFITGFSAVMIIQKSSAAIEARIERLKGGQQNVKDEKGGAT